MGNRRDTQRKHERAVVADFLDWLRTYRGANFAVVAELDPPDAIIESRRLKSWVEVTDGFGDGNWARDLYSYATPDEEHVPIDPGPYLDPDLRFAENFARALSQKLIKESYRPIARELGPGYLVVNVEYPLFNLSAYRAAEAEWGAGRPWNNLGCFKEVYAAFRSRNGRAFRKWKL